MKTKGKSKLPVRQLAELAGVPIPTIKHYVNEGLIPKPLKSGKTMAYYDEACVEKVKLIKKLQKEKFLPLEVIKRVLDSGAAYKEELKLGQAIFKSHKQLPDVRPISETYIERRIGYPLHKIRLLEKEGLVAPVSKGGGRYYDSIDCRIIEMMKEREELGVPFDYSIETVKIYRDAIARAVREDMRLFARNVLGDVSTRQAVKFLTEADDSLDSFVVLYRHKMLRSLSGSAVRQINDLAENLSTLSFLPVKGDELPASPPDQPLLRVLYFFLTGSYDSITGLTKSLPRKEPYIAAEIIANVLRADSKRALDAVEHYIQKPTQRGLSNTAAALAYGFSIGAASGLSAPMYLVKRCLGYLKRIEIANETDDPAGLLSRYVCGAIYVMLPDIFDTCETGVKMLEGVLKCVSTRKLKLGRSPAWLAKTVRHEILPVIEIKLNRFLAEAHLRQGDSVKARSHLQRIIQIADPDDENSKWARLRKFEEKEPEP